MRITRFWHYSTKHDESERPEVFCPSTHVALPRTCHLRLCNVMSSVSAADHARWYVEQLIVPAARRLALAKLRRQRPRPRRLRRQRRQQNAIAKKEENKDGWWWWWGSWSWSVFCVGALCVVLFLVVRWRRQLRAWGGYVLAPSEPTYLA